MELGTAINWYVVLQMFQITPLTLCATLQEIVRMHFQVAFNEPIPTHRKKAVLYKFMKANLDQGISLSTGCYLKLSECKQVVIEFFFLILKLEWLLLLCTQCIQ